MSVASHRPDAAGRDISLSLEFFPPKTAETSSRLGETARALAAVSPEYVSVTYGAGGSTREGSLDTVRQMRGVFSDVAPHISCIGANAEQIETLLDGYLGMGIRRLIALRGDLPSGFGGAGEFAHASDLVRFIRKRHGDAFDIEDFRQFP